MRLCVEGGVLNCMCGCQVRGPRAWLCVPEEECSIAGEVVRSGSLEPGGFTKIHEVPGGSEGTLCPRTSAQLRVRLSGQGAWSLVVLQSTMKYQGALMGLYAQRGVLKSG